MRQIFFLRQLKQVWPVTGVGDMGPKHEKYGCLVVSGSANSVGQQVSVGCANVAGLFGSNHHGNLMSRTLCLSGFKIIWLRSNCLNGMACQNFSRECKRNCENQNRDKRNKCQQAERSMVLYFCIWASGKYSQPCTSC